MTVSDDDPELRVILIELERRALSEDGREPLNVRIARIQAMLVAAFGEADFAVVTGSADTKSA